MLKDVLAPLNQVVLDRLTLFLNHVLSSEPAATAKLAGHAGATLHVRWSRLPPLMPSLLPPPAEPSFAVTPAGLLERVGDAAAKDAAPDGSMPASQSGAATLTVLVDLSDPVGWIAALQAGQHPPMEIQGDARLAADVSWIVDNVRWDLEDDLSRIVGDAPARTLTRFGQGFVAALRRFVEPLVAARRR